MGSSFFRRDAFDRPDRVAGEVLEEKHKEILVPVFYENSIWRDAAFKLSYSVYKISASVCNSTEARDFDLPQFWDIETFTVYSYTIWVVANPQAVYKTRQLSLSMDFPHAVAGVQQVEFDSFIDMLWHVMENFRETDNNG